jgi:hypothetical protein
VRLVPGPRGRGPRPPAIASRVAEVDASPAAAAPRRRGVKENAHPRGRGKYFLLTPRTL